MMMNVDLNAGSRGYIGGVWETRTDAGMRLARRQLGKAALTPEEYQLWYTKRYMPDVAHFEDDPGCHRPLSGCERLQLCVVNGLLGVLECICCCSTYGAGSGGSWG